MPDEDETRLALSMEAMDVLHWRIRRFLELDFNIRQARVLAQQHADWHAAQHMLAGHCPIDTAFDILS